MRDTHTSKKTLLAPSALSALALGAALSGCGAAPTQPNSEGARGTTCSPDQLDVCERAIAKAAAEGTAPEALVKGYAAARASNDPNDPWAKLWGGMGSSKGGAILVDERGGGAANPLGKVNSGKNNRFISSAPLPQPKAIAAE